MTMIYGNVRINFLVQVKRMCMTIIYGNVKINFWSFCLETFDRSIFISPHLGRSFATSPWAATRVQQTDPVLFSSIFEWERKWWCELCNKCRCIALQNLHLVYPSIAEINFHRCRGLTYWQGHTRIMICSMGSMGFCYHVTQKVLKYCWRYIASTGLNTEIITLVETL